MAFLTFLGLLMNKSELISHVASKHGISKKDISHVIDAVISTISERLKEGDEIQIVGFGTLKVAERATRVGRNPKTGLAMMIPPRRTPVFKASIILKKLVALE